jgi:hypothetical protein
MLKLVLAVSGVVALASFAMAQAPDWILVNANIYTVNPAQPQAEALAVRGGRLVAVGGNAAIRRLAGGSTKVVDAGGMTVVPGLIDAHGHMLGLGQSLQRLDVHGANSPAEVGELVKREAARRKPGEWIQGRGWDQNKYPSREFPTHEALTAAAPDNPVLLTRVDGHAAWVNAKAMELAGITAATSDPEGGRIIRDSSGRPTGIFVDHAQGLVGSRLPRGTQADTLEALALAAKECVRLGLTGAHDAGEPLNVINAYKELIAAKRLPLRVYAMIGGAGPALDQYFKSGPEIGFGNGHLTVRSIKIIADGALGSRGAALIDDYSDEPGNRGLLTVTPDELLRVSEQALEHGFQVNTHAIGDRANRLVLDIYEAALLSRKQFPRDHRFRIEHAQILAPSDFPRLARLGIIASMQATHATSDMPWAERRIGHERAKGAYAWRTMLNAGARLADGSDFPVESPNPLFGIYAAITRQDQAGNPAGGWFPEERLTREEALRSFTIDAAYAAFEEKEKGSLEVGKLADFVVLSRDIMKVPPSQIPTTEVLRTVVGGETVYQK